MRKICARAQILKVKSVTALQQTVREYKMLLTYQLFSSGPAVALLRELGQLGLRSLATYGRSITTMAGKNIAVLGIFPSDAHAENAAMRLMESGFTSEDISVLLHEHSGPDGAHTETPDATNKTAGSTRQSGASGPGGALGSLSNIGALTIPGVGKFIAGGPMRAILSSIGTSLQAGDLAGAFVGMRIPGDDARRLEDRIRSGGAMLSVRCSSSVSVTRAENLLKQAGAQDVASDSEGAAGSTGSNKSSEARM